MSPQAQAPAWFHNAVLSGLQFLWALGLPGTPAGEVAALTATSWVQALWLHPLRWTEEQDLPRLTEAFTTVAARTERWPTPRNVLDALPPRPPAQALAHQGTLPPPALRNKIAQLTGRLTQPTGDAA